MLGSCRRVIQKMGSISSLPQSSRRLAAAQAFLACNTHRQYHFCLAMSGLQTTDKTKSKRYKDLAPKKNGGFLTKITFAKGLRADRTWVCCAESGSVPFNPAAEGGLLQGCWGGLCPCEPAYRLHHLVCQRTARAVGEGPRGASPLLLLRHMS